jgi:hypothetical protein
MILLRVPDALFLADGKPAREKTTHDAKATVNIGGHAVKTLLYVLNFCPRNKIILGAGWLLCHGPRLGFATQTMTFASPYCKANCTADAHSLIQVPFTAAHPEQSCSRATQENPVNVTA